MNDGGRPRKNRRNDEQFGDIFHSGAHSRRLTRPKHKVTKLAAHCEFGSRRRTKHLWYLNTEKSMGLDELHLKNFTYGLERFYYHSNS